MINCVFVSVHHGAGACPGGGDGGGRRPLFEMLTYNFC